MTDTDKSRLSSCGNPYIEKGDGDEVVQAYIAAMPEWKSAVGERIDAIVEKVFPDVRKQVRWNTPFYGKEDGWFLAMYCYSKYVQITFLSGALLDPMPPKASKVGDTRYWEIHKDDDFDVEQLADWVRQSLKLNGHKLT